MVDEEVEVEGVTLGVVVVETGHRKAIGHHRSAFLTVMQHSA